MIKETYTDSSEVLKKQGALIVVCGRSGSGKSTLVCEAFKNFKDLEYLKTYTTRLPRSEAEMINSYEYEFVTQEQYDSLRLIHPNWDHTTIYGESYGADIDKVFNSLRNGINLIVNSIPTIEAIDDLRNKYGYVKVIALEVAKNLLEHRISSERPQSEMNRLVADELMDFEEVKQVADVIFTPSSKLEEDIIEFCKIIETLISS